MLSPMERIDVHAHFVPPIFDQRCRETGHAKPDGMPGIPAWCEDDHLDLMETLNIKKSILSISSPGPYLVPNFDNFARDTARQCNEFAAEMKRRRPDQFGFWASVPLPDVKGALKEIDYALDTLNADGIGLETNSHGHYLGDPKFKSIFHKLNEKKATVFLHPTAPCMLTDRVTLPCTPWPKEKYPYPIFEFLFDTARTIIDLFLSKTIENHPNITFVIPHVGGALPPLIPRFCNLPTMIGMDGVEEAVVKKQLKEQFYFDLAGFALPDQLMGLLPFTTSKRLLYGSDYPYTPRQTVEDVSAAMTDDLAKIFPHKHDQEDIYYNNAANLLRPKPKVDDGHEHKQEL